MLHQRSIKFPKGSNSELFPNPQWRAQHQIPAGIKFSFALPNK
jgi:hypothetical protein